MSLSQVIEGYLTPILASRYLPAGSLTVILWDHLITLDREVRLVWRSRGRSNEKWILNSAYVFNRYGAEACLLFIAYVSSGIKAPSSAVCRSYVTLMLFCGTVALEISQFVLLLRVHYLTDQRRVILYYLIAGFTIAVSISQTFAVLTMLDLRKNVAAISIAGLNSCAAFKKPPFFSGILAPMFAFDIFIILLTIYNALERPHRSNAELITSLYKDGARFFIVRPFFFYALESYTHLRGW
ncbi:hypothetical protein BDQ17DRAFT_1306539 [Cyathus striatus]|nr:hypothetical protein BDQ17DRAFT_1306539 [Cyathus striatus]